MQTARYVRSNGSVASFFNGESTTKELTLHRLSTCDALHLPLPLHSRAPTSAKYPLHSLETHSRIWTSLSCDATGWPRSTFHIHIDARGVNLYRGLVPLCLAGFLRFLSRLICIARRLSNNYHPSPPAALWSFLFWHFRHFPCISAALYARHGSEGT